MILSIYKVNYIYCLLLFLKTLLLRWLLLKIDAFDLSHFTAFEQIKIFSSHFTNFEQVKNFNSHFTNFGHVKKFDFEQ